MKHVKIAVDGPAGSGKSSVAREAALKLNIKYIDSGALYRSVTWHFLENNIVITPHTDFDACLKDLQITQEFLPSGLCVTRVMDRDVSSLIRSETVAKNIGIVSDSIAVRNFINGLLRNFALQQSVIMDGRDIGTVVFPDSDLKIYLDASVDVRAMRRVHEYEEMGKNVDEKLIKNQIIHRDKQDRSRPFGKLVRADDAVYVDTTELSKEEVIDKLTEMIQPILRV